MREEERQRIRNEAEVHAEKLRLQKIAYEAAKEAERMKAIKDQQEDEERRRRIRVERE